VFQDQEKRLLIYFDLKKTYIWSIEPIEKISCVELRVSRYMAVHEQDNINEWSNEGLSFRYFKAMKNVWVV
jgi:hypothetical protein